MRKSHRFDKYDDAPIISAGGIIFRRSKTKVNDWEFLLLRNKRGGHSWGFPKGRREKGENDLKTATREIYEETGLRRQDLQILKRLKNVIRYTVNRGSRLLPKEVRLFLIRVSNDIQVRLSQEHISAMWLSYEEALRKVKYDSSKTTLIEAYKWIQENSSLLTDRTDEIRTH